MVRGKGDEYHLGLNMVAVILEPIQKAIGSSDGIEYLSKLLKPARLDHGELVTVLLAARALDNLMHEGM